MIESAASGLLAAAIICFALFSEKLINSGNTFGWLRSLLFLLAVGVAALYQSFNINRLGQKIRSGFSRNYLGIPDMLVQIHAPSRTDRPARWAWKGLLSLLLCVSHGIAGVEGAAAELGFAIRMSLRPKSSRWSEQIRRTDNATILAAAISGAFCAPFAAVLMPIELGMGGRTLYTVVAAITACFGVKEGINILHLSPLMDFNSGLDGMDYRSLPLWMALAAIAIIGGFLGAGFVQLWTFFYRSLTQISRRWNSMKCLLAGLVIFLVIQIYPMSAEYPQNLFRDLLADSFTSNFNFYAGYGFHGGILLFSRTLILALFIAGVGSIGIIWPLLTLGACMGLALQHFAIPPALSSYLPMMLLAGSASLLSAVMGTPISSAVLIYEFTGQVEAGIFALFVSQISNRVARSVSHPLVDQGLRLKGLAIAHGRSVSVLESIPVKDVMVTDHEVIHERESLMQVSHILMNSKYPFLPVVSKSGVYTGMVTVDMLQARLEESKDGSIVSKYFEVKDLLYRSQSKEMVVSADDTLASTQELFQELPCAPVLDQNKKVQGLLFVHHVRLAYEREVAKRFLLSTYDTTKTTP